MILKAEGRQLDILESEVLITQFCLTLCEPTDYSPPDSSVHGILE